MSAAYDGAAKLNAIGQFVSVYNKGGRSIDVDDCGTRFEESGGLGRL